VGIIYTNTREFIAGVFVDQFFFSLYDDQARNKEHVVEQLQNGGDQACHVVNAAALSTWLTPRISSSVWMMPFEQATVSHAQKR